MTPKVKLEVSKQNFVFKATKVWNKLIGHALERTEPEISGLIIPGSARNSDLSASKAFVKGKIKIKNLHTKFSKIESYLFMVINLRYVQNLIKFDFSGSHAY